MGTSKLTEFPAEDAAEPERFASAMPSVQDAAVVRVEVLGPLRLTVGGREVPLTPAMRRILVRLVAAEGRVVPISRLRSDLWPAEPSLHKKQIRIERGQVQRHVSELRGALRAAGAESAGLISTDRTYSESGHESGYRFDAGCAQCDYVEFAALIYGATAVPAAPAVTRLLHALELWRDDPLIEAGGASYASALAGRLVGLYDQAVDDLIGYYRRLGRLDAAADLARRRVEARPTDPEAAAVLRELHDQLRQRNAGVVLLREFPRLGAAVSLVSGDLFDQKDADLAILCADNFGVGAPERESAGADSLLSQLLGRWYAGERDRLESELARALPPPTSPTHGGDGSRSAGNQATYALGTVAAVSRGEQRVYCVASTRSGGGATAVQSDVLNSLGELWRSTALAGRSRPLAVPLTGYRMLRRQPGPELIMLMIIDTFLAACRAFGPAGPQLRIVLRPAVLARADIDGVETYTSSLDELGRRPAG